MTGLWDKYMDGSTIIIILVVAFVIWVLFFRKINPSNKTDAQLQWMYNMAMRSWDPMKKNESLELIEAEMKKRGLLGDNKPGQHDNTLIPSEQKKLDEAIKLFEESGMQAEMQKMFASGIPEKIFNKTIEIARIRGISERDASSYFNELFEAASRKYKNMGLSQNEADEKALVEVLATEVKNPKGSSG